VLVNVDMLDVEAAIRGVVADVKPPIQRWPLDDFFDGLALENDVKLAHRGGIYQPSSNSGAGLPTIDAP
jgi:hypothetical protein